MSLGIAPRYPPASQNQTTLWYIAQAGEPPFAYHEQTQFRIDGRLSIPLLEHCLNTLIERHETLRTSFEKDQNGDIIQVIHPPYKVTVETIPVDSEPRSRATLEKAIQETALEYCRQPYDLTQLPLFRVTLLNLPENNSVVLFNYHHIILDGRSFDNFLTEWQLLNAAYLNNTPPVLPAPLKQSSDYAREEKQFLASPTCETSKRYWSALLKDAPPRLNLPCKNTHASRNLGARQKVVIERNLDKLAAQLRVSANDILLAASYVLLSRYSGQSDICLGSQRANRPAADFKNTLGYITNNTVLRLNLSGDKTVIELLREVHTQKKHAAYTYPLPYSLITDIARKNGLPAGAPLCQFSLGYSNLRFGKPVELAEGVSITDMRVASPGDTKFEALWALRELNGRIEGYLEYDVDRFDAAMAARFTQHYAQIIAAIVDNPEQRIEAISFITEKERQKILIEWNDTKSDYPQHCIHELFERQAKKSPNNTAVVLENNSLTYAELNNKSNQLANYLQAINICADTLVGLCVKRSLDMIVGILGILKAGGAYVPIDPEYPTQRITEMLTDSGIKVLLTQSAVKNNLPATGDINTVCLDTEWIRLEGYTIRNPAVRVTPDNLAYVIYTSGSTGKPKGVMVEHHAMVNHMHWMRTTIAMGAHDKVLQKSPLTFDAAGSEWALPLLIGATLVLAKHDGHRDADYLLSLIETAQITVLQVVPALLSLLLANPDVHKLRALRYLICGGEALPVALCEKFKQSNIPAEFYNLYGPTEATIDTTYFDCRQSITSNSIPIGKPIANTQLYILDNGLHPVPVGVVGELHISGAGVARGYLNRPQLTAERFVPSPVIKDVRLYKTGDLARWLADGNIEYIGRADNQVKLRGFRIELGEIEHALAQQLGVAECAVIARDGALAAYLVANADFQPPLPPGNHYTAVFDNYYQESVSVTNDPFLNFIGWNRSDTGEQIAFAEMRSWLDSTAALIRQELDLMPGPKHILDIGCGLGLFLKPLLPHCDHYTGLDISRQAIAYLEEHLPALGEAANNVTLHVGGADTLPAFSGQTIQLIVFNSVVQYFPDIDYLSNAITAAENLLAPGGVIFIGDVRNLDTLPAFHTGLALARHRETDTPPAALQHYIQQQIDSDGELVIAPAFFRQLQKELSGLCDVRILPKLCDGDNELTRYRYDVILYKRQGRARHDRAITWTPWDDHRYTLAELGVHLTREKPPAFAVTGIPNPLVAGDDRAAALYQSDTNNMATAGVLKKHLAAAASGITPYQLKLLAESRNYITVFNLQSSTNGAYDVVFYRQDNKKSAPPYTPFPQHKIDITDRSQLSNNPQQQRQKRYLLTHVRETLTQHLPDYMVPATFTVLDTLPLTANGKLDHTALPAPVVEYSRQGYVAPATETETQLTTIWADILNLDAKRLSTHDHFIELGGDSITSVQVTIRARKVGLQFEVKDVMQCQTIAALAQIVQVKDPAQGEHQLPDKQPPKID